MSTALTQVTRNVWQQVDVGVRKRQDASTGDGKVRLAETDAQVVGEHQAGRHKAWNSVFEL